ncbi:MAG: biotin--[acetyl-CoA-carboxylase] ligase [Deltaproteobacteria bacterium]|nr:biotin--[acetyl-CoA-carboxylase] ligase [Deltaproteobacteria bacterium]
MTDSKWSSISSRKVHYIEELDSTNIHAHKLAESGAEEGETVVADRQLKGRGRLSRTWQSPAGKNVYLSIIIKPSLLLPERASQITIAAGVAVAQVISIYCRGNAMLKWPNDVLVNNKKICGILTELKTKGREIDYIVVGIGINVNIAKDEFPEEFRERATSIFEETARLSSRIDVARDICRSFDVWRHRLLHAGGFESVREEWLRISAMKGKTVKIDDRGTLHVGTMENLGDCGELILRDNEGRLIPILAGDATVLKEEQCS